MVRIMERNLLWLKWMKYTIGRFVFVTFPREGCNQTGKNNTIADTWLLLSSRIYIYNIYIYKQRGHFTSTGNVPAFNPTNQFQYNANKNVSISFHTANIHHRLGHGCLVTIQWCVARNVCRLYIHATANKRLFEEKITLGINLQALYLFVITKMMCSRPIPYKASQIHIAYRLKIMCILIVYSCTRT